MKRKNRDYIVNRWKEKLYVGDVVEYHVRFLNHPIPALIVDVEWDDKIPHWSVRLHILSNELGDKDFWIDESGIYFSKHWKFNK